MSKGKWYRDLQKVLDERGLAADVWFCKKVWRTWVSVDIPLDTWYKYSVSIGSVVNQRVLNGPLCGQEEEFHDRFWGNAPRRPMAEW